VSEIFRGQQPLSFMALPWLGEVRPGDVLTGIAAEVVAGRPDFEHVDDAPADVAADASAADPEPAPAAASPSKPRKTAAKPGVSA